jgi:CBS domain-containing protein
VLSRTAPWKVAAKQVMNPDVITVRDDMTVPEAAAFLIENQITGAPVEDGEGRLVGVVSYTDIARAASDPNALEPPLAEPDFFTRGWEEAPFSNEEMRGLHVTAGLTVADIMTPQLHSIAADASVSEAACLMLEAHIHRLLVTRDHKVVGILTTSDLLKLLVDDDTAMG